MNSSGQITVRQWFALPKSHRKIRVAQFRAADRALQENAKWERRLKIRGETQVYLNLNNRVNDLWPTVPWWVRR